MYIKIKHIAFFISPTHRYVVGLLKNCLTLSVAILKNGLTVGEAFLKKKYRNKK